MKYVKLFKELGKEDIPIAGGKGANLGELTSAGIPVPPGFVVLSTAYFAFLEHNHLRPKIHRILDSCDVSDPHQLTNASREIKKLLRGAEIPDAISREIFESYHRLSASHYKMGSNLPVAVRSSATAEDLPDASFAGQQDSFLNIIGDANVLLKVKECWMSLFGARSIFYRQQKKFDHFKVSIAVPVQKMVQSEVSGVMFTVDPISKDKNKLVIEAAFGLGDYIVQGVVTPDHYEIEKSSLDILSRQIHRQDVMEIRSQLGVKEVKVPSKLREKQKLSDRLIEELTRLGKKIHQHYFFPQDIEWAMEGGDLFITQARPITTLDQSSPQVPSSGDLQPTNDVLKKLGPPVLKGAPASPGLISGPVKLVPDVKNLGKVKPGDIMVTDMTTPDFEIGRAHV